MLYPGIYGTDNLILNQQGETSSTAAEFYEATHHIWVNGTQTFEQHNWYDCNPNPDGCQPQNGTWYHNRDGWCPGAIAQWFDYDLTPYISQGSIDMDYVFYENYVDYCHPNHPACVTGVICADAPLDGTVEIFDMSGRMLDQFMLVGVASTFDLSAYPNGAYIVTVKANGLIETQTLIIQK